MRKLLPVLWLMFATTDAYSNETAPIEISCDFPTKEVPQPHFMKLRNDPPICSGSTENISIEARLVDADYKGVSVSEAGPNSMIVKGPFSYHPTSRIKGVTVKISANHLDVEFVTVANADIRYMVLFDRDPSVEIEVKGLPQHNYTASFKEKIESRAPIERLAK